MRERDKSFVELFVHVFLEGLWAKCTGINEQEGDNNIEEGEG